MPTTDLPPVTPALLRLRWPQGQPAVPGLPAPFAVGADWQLDIRPGLTWICGDEGRGKTLLLRMLAGDPAVPPACREGPAAVPAGVAWFDPAATGLPGQSDPTADAVLQAAARHHPHFSVEACADLMDDLQLQAHRGKRLSMLSAGSRRKVWLTAALAAGAPVTLLDQPFAALDGRSVALLRELLASVAVHPRRAWVVADYTVPPDVTPDQRIDLG